MTLDDYRSHFNKTLATLYPEEEITSISSIVLEHVLGMNRVEVALSRKLQLKPQQINELDAVLERLKRSEPVQYIIGQTEFYGLELQLNRATLIPRPETEELVTWVLEETTKKQPIEVLDIGTGSGCIAIALAKQLPNARVEAVDISMQAIETAMGNAQNNQTEVTFFRQDILEAESLPRRYDVIASNPPYVRNMEKREIKENVLQHEPHTALFVSDNDPLIFYRKIAKLAVNNLTIGGQLFFEINEYLGEETVMLVKEVGFSKVILKKDLFGKNRMIRAIK